jgi:acetyltransferase
VILGVARLSRLPGTREAEFSMLISDQYQGRRLGTELVRRLIHIGREEKLEKIRADIMAENVVMQRVCEKLGFLLHHEPADGLVSAELDLGGHAATSQPAGQ